MYTSRCRWSIDIVKIEIKVCVLKSFTWVSIYVAHCRGCMMQLCAAFGIGEKSTPVRISRQFNAHKTDDVIIIIIIPSNYVTVIAFQNTFFSAVCCYTLPGRNTPIACYCTRLNEQWLDSHYNFLTGIYPRSA